MPRKHRGSTLATALAVIALASLSVAVLLSAAFFQMSAASSLLDSTRSRNRVDSVLALAMAQLMGSNGAYGTAGESVQAALPGDASGVVGSLSFATSARPHSTNNLLSDSSTRLWNGAGLAPRLAYLYAVSQNQTTVTWATEIFLHVPPYPYVVASSGPILSTASMTVGSLDPTRPPPASPPSAANLLPGDIASNSTASLAINLSAQSVIDGDARAAGGIKAAPQSIKGGVYPGAGSIPLPLMNISSFAPQPQNVMTQLAADMGGMTLEGYCASTADAHFHGDVTVDDAVVYVPGNLTIDGALHGTGAIFATGAMTIGGADGPSDLQTDNHVALAAGGAVTVNGQGQQNSFFRGLIYTQGSLTANHLTLLGTFVGNGGPGAGVTLNDASALFVAAYADVSFNVSLPPAYNATPVDSYIPPIPMYAYWNNTDTNPPAPGQIGFIQATVQPFQAPAPAGAGPGVITVQYYTVSTLGFGHWVVPPTISTYSGPSCADDAAAAIEQAMPQPVLGSNSVAQRFDQARLAQDLLDAFTTQPSQAAVANASNPAIGAFGGGTQPYSIGVDQFIGIGDRIRVMLWRQR
jgi:hypothetical protein